MGIELNSDLRLKMKVGITGQSGFIGKHLYNTLGLFPAEFERISFEPEYFDDEDQLQRFVAKCDTIVHLAALNRHSDPQVIYDTNVGLVKKLVSALTHTGSKAHVIFSSSTQEEKDNLYGRSKKAGREMMANWAKNSGGKFSGLIIPNVFGPFGRPNYNSVVATFCYKLTHSETPHIDVDNNLQLIYVGELIEEILKEIRSGNGNEERYVPYTSECTVSHLLSLLSRYRSEYFEGGIISELNSKFEINLFNTFRCYMDIEKHFPVKFTRHTDARGAFVEVIRLHTGGQVSFSTTRPGITRGNHFHTRKIERFAVIKGKALIQLRQIGTNKVVNFELEGAEPACVDMPVWFTHNIKNTGEDDLFTIFWINEFYDPNDPDTFFEDVENIMPVNNGD